MNNSHTSNILKERSEELAHQYGATAILLQVIDSTNIVARPYGEILDDQTSLSYHEVSGFIECSSLKKEMIRWGMASRLLIFLGDHKGTPQRGNAH